MEITELEYSLFMEIACRFANVSRDSQYLNNIINEIKQERSKINEDSDNKG